MLKKITNFMSWSTIQKVRYACLIMSYLRFFIFTRPFLKQCGSGSIIQKPLLITPEYIILGAGVIIMPGCRIEGISNYTGDDNYQPEIVFEDGVTLQQRCHITSASRLVICKNSLISFDVSIQDTDHEYQQLDMPIANQPLLINETRIGENCFIGSGVKIQAGTILGKQCIVGTNAVVRGVFPDFSVIVGIPAKIVKRYNPASERWEKTNAKGEFLSDL
ncbi:DapH/DapD/GlmU-related protein [Rheinheimera pacifica]|uniref:DapH/DapD/GlmU-related protein n=1 Tax=Rheinheimera pacifica TaxID=173990 RepID=UPI002EDB1426